MTLNPSNTHVRSRNARNISDSMEYYASQDAMPDPSRSEGSRRASEGEENKKAWLRKPSPWWMLTLMPLSAMTLAGVSPSLLQIYTELACKDIRGPAPSALAFADAAKASKSMNATHLLEYSYMSAVEEHGRPLVLFFRAIEIDEDGGEEDGGEEQSCAKDPVVQAAVSKLLTVLMTTQGILSLITAASWASLSDRLGRRFILSIAASAVTICYSIFIAVYYFADHLPGGYWLLVFGSFFHGVLGGSAGATAGTNAYIADCTSAPVRAQIFSLALGLRFTGMAIGPTLCAVLVRVTGTPISALTLVVGWHIAYLLLTTLVVPESLSSENCAENRRIWRESRERSISRNPDARAGGVRARATWLLSVLASNVFAFLRPLSIAGPITITHPSGKTHKDWSLTFIALSAGLASIILASNSSMFLFGAATYGWSAVELGYWFSGITAARALTLTLFLPAIIKIYFYYTIRAVKPSATHSDSLTSEAAPLLSDDQDASSTPREAGPFPQTRVQLRKTPSFDLAIAQASLGLEVVCYALIPVLFSWGPIPFIVLTILAACGAGFGPAIQALAIDLYAARGGTETGRLFGVLSVVQATSSQIIGPTIYGLVYMKIVATYPQGIFFVSVGAVAIALTFLLFVELPGKKGAGSAQDGGNDV